MCTKWSRLAKSLVFKCSATLKKNSKIATILLLDLCKTELQNVRYSNLFGIPIFGIQAPTVYHSIIWTCLFPDTYSEHSIPGTSTVRRTQKPLNQMLDF